jgi:hypothetical protein
VELSPLLPWPFISLLYQPWMIDGNDCGARETEIHGGILPQCHSDVT